MTRKKGRCPKCKSRELCYPSHDCYEYTCKNCGFSIPLELFLIGEDEEDEDSYGGLELDDLRLN